MRVYNTPLEVYRDRLTAIGFVKMQHVLDAGCGFGQWSLALSDLNNRVSACDVSAERLQIAERISSKIEISNVHFEKAKLHTLPYDNDSFDGIFCYSVLQLTPWRGVITELARVLRPGGKLYLTANGLGWYLHTWKQEPNKNGDYDPRLRTALTFANTVRYERGDDRIDPGGDVLIEQNNLVDTLGRTGFEVDRTGAEGTINLCNSVNITPFFQGEYEGHPGVYEILAHKKVQQ